MNKEIKRHPLDNICSRGLYPNPKKEHAEEIPTVQKSKTGHHSGRKAGFKIPSPPKQTK